MSPNLTAFDVLLNHSNGRRFNGKKKFWGFICIFILLALIGGGGIILKMTMFNKNEGNLNSSADPDFEELYHSEKTTTTTVRNTLQVRI